MLVEIDLQEAVSNGATAGGIDRLDGNTIDFDNLARVNLFDGSDIESGETRVTDYHHATRRAQFACHA